MANVTRHSILLGFMFIVGGLLKALSDRWQTKLVVQGFHTRIPHTFSHVFVLLWIKQLLQMSLYFLWNAISNGRCGLGRLKHGEVQQPGARRGGGRLDENLDLDHDNPILGGNNQRAENDQPQHDEPAQEDEVPAIAAQGNIQVAPEENGIDATEAENVRDDQPLLGQDCHEDEGVVENEIRNRRSAKSYSKLIYFPPALFDVLHVLLLYFGVKLTYSSSFIMLKGSIGFFAALLSMAFLAQQLAVYIWFGVILTGLGFAALGVVDYVHNTPEGYEKYGIAAGDLLIAMSQIMFATKLVFEEKFVRKHSIHPMHFLGCEGFYGFSFASILLIVFEFVNATQYSELPNGNVEDIQDFCWQFAASWQVEISVLGSVLMFIVYRYLGMFLVRDYGALPRIMIELFMWALFWGISLAAGWDQTYISQVPGFVVVLIGLLIYSHILVMPFQLCDRQTQDNLGQGQNGRVLNGGAHLGFMAGGGNDGYNDEGVDEGLDAQGDEREPVGEEGQGAVGGPHASVDVGDDDDALLHVHEKGIEQGRNGWMGRDEDMIEG